MREKIKRDIRGLSRLPTVSAIQTKLLELFRKENATVADLAEVVRHDQSLASRVIAMANAPFLGRPGRISTLDDAIFMLGFDIVKGLAVGMSLFSLVPARNQRFESLWGHAYLTGMASKILVARMQSGAPEEAFLSGLLHDIGRVALAHVLGGSYEDRLAGAPDTSGSCLSDLESGLFGCSHEEAGIWFLEGLSLPSELVSPILFHHHLPEARLHEPATAALFLAEGLLGLEGGEFREDGRWLEKHGLVLAEAGIPARELSHLSDQINRERMHLQVFFGR